VFRYDPKLPNEHPFAEPPDIFPYPPAVEWRQIADDYANASGIYFAGKCSPSPDEVNFGYPVIYNLREHIARTLRDELGGTCVGNGWGRSTFDGEWHRRKFREIARANPRYVLAIENCLMPDAISEKIWAGLLTDRVTLYLGAPNVADYIDPAAFVDLGRFIHYAADSTLWFDADALLDVLARLDHNAMRRAARAVVDGVSNGRDRCTQRVIDVIEESWKQ